MATALLMPKQGNSVESCIILEWMKKEGDTVKTGETLCEAETDKATIEVESVCDGTILKIYYDADSEVPVQKIIAVIGEPGEDISSFDAEAAIDTQGDSSSTGDDVQSVQEVVPAEPAAAAAAPAAPASIDSGSGAVSPRAKNLAAGKGINTAAIAGTGPKGRVIERDILAAAGVTQPLTPAAAAALIEKGLSAPASGSGIGGRVRLQDLGTVSAGTAAAAVNPDFPGSFHDQKVKGVRKITASRMMESLSSTAQLTHNFSAAAEALLSYRAKLKASPEELGLNKISINDILMFVTARVLKNNPEFNMHWYGDSMRFFDSVHLGFACDTPKGLLVPVIKYADQLSLKQLADESSRLIAACRDGKAQPEDLAGATFTVSNVGAFGIESFTPIVNPPEVAILGVCSTQLRPVRTDSGVEYKDFIGFSLTYDHQANDGAPASRFCAAVIKAVENLDVYLAF